MANIQHRAGSVMVRVGGNTQESAKLVEDGVIPDGRVLTKNLTGVTGTTQTPPLEFSRDLLYMMRNISSFVNVHWFLGIPWFVTQPFDTKIITASQEILETICSGCRPETNPTCTTFISIGMTPTRPSIMAESSRTSSPRFPPPTLTPLEKP
jgi:hypothetical protein